MRRKEAWEETQFLPCSQALGSGTYGSVYLGFDAADIKLDMNQRSLVAIKECPIKELAAWGESQTTPVGQVHCNPSVLIEVTLLRCMRHENIVRLLFTYVIAETTSVYLVMEYCDAGTLTDELCEQPNGWMVESYARYYFKQIVAGIAYMHDKHLVHRDLKPANILLRISPDRKNKIVKIADFGLSAIYMLMHDGELDELAGDQIYGTRPFVPPEALIIVYGKGNQQAFARQVCSTFSRIPIAPLDKRFLTREQLKELASKRRPHVFSMTFANTMYRLPPLDVYAAGVMLYIMLTCRYPYLYRQYPKNLDLVCRGEPIRSKYQINDETFAFIMRMMCPNPAHRLNIHQVAQDPWIGGRVTTPGHVVGSPLPGFLSMTHIVRDVQSEGYGHIKDKPVIIGPDGKPLVPHVSPSPVAAAAAAVPTNSGQQSVVHPAPAQLIRSRSESNLSQNRDGHRERQAQSLPRNHRHEIRPGHSSPERQESATAGSRVRSLGRGKKTSP